MTNLHHDARSLGKYIGMPVKFEHEGYISGPSGSWVEFNLDHYILDSFKPSPDFKIIEWMTCRMYSTLDKNYYEEISGGPITTVSPILKPYTALITPMMHNGVEIVPANYLYGYHEIWHFHNDYIIGRFTELRFVISIYKDFESSLNEELRRYALKNSMLMQERLLELGFGAIECKESPTGWISVHDGKICEVSNDVR
jgi:hypothetical protein